MADSSVKRKTFTSSEVKNRWNKQHYKQVSCQLNKELVHQGQEKLKSDGISKSEFIRNAIKAYLKTGEEAEKK